jgi:stage V sporulation protein SpoVS
LQCGSDRGAGEESGNAGRSVRDPGHRCMHNVDAGAMAALVRRKGRVGHKGCAEALAVTKVGRQRPAPPMGAAARCTFARSERRRRVRVTDAGALAALVRRKGRVEHEGDGGGQKPLQK